jgi:predicted amidohydrolase YtcJ
MKGLLFSNGTIASINPNNDTIDAIYVEDGKIQAIGTSSELRLQLATKDYQTIDLQGSYILPGLVDSHMHLSLHGMKLTMLDFSGVTSKEEMLYLLKQRVQKTPYGEWIFGLNWDENVFAEATPPTIEELNHISDNHPIYLTRTCHHVFVANAMAFQLAGITDSTPNTLDGSYGRDASGRLNGLIYEKASKPFIACQPKPDYAMKKDYMRRAAKHALSLGLTAAHTEDIRYLGGISTLLAIHRDLMEEGIYFRSHHLIYHRYLSELEGLGMHTGSGDEWLQIGAVKIFADGAIGGRTALLSKPYHDSPDTLGMAIHTQGELEEITARARQLGMPIAVHAIGDGGADMAIRAMENNPIKGLSRFPDRIIHAQVMRLDLIERLKKLQVAIDIQPRFVVSDFPWVIERVGEDRLAYLYAWKKLLSAGLLCGGGSDAPIEPLDPFLGIHAAVTRKKPGQLHEGYLPDEKLSIQEGIHLFTLGSAQTAGEEAERGSLHVGKYADMTIVDKNPYCGEPDDLLHTKVLMTIVNGRVAYLA